MDLLEAAAMPYHRGMHGLTRALAAWLALSLAAAPAVSAAGFERVAPVQPLALPAGPLSSAPSLVASPATPALPLPNGLPPIAASGAVAALPRAVPGHTRWIRPGAGGETASGAAAAQKPAALPQLRVAADPRRAPELAGLSFDGGRPLAESSGETPAGLPGPGPSAGAPKPLLAPSAAPKEGAPRPPQPPSPAPKRPSWLKRLQRATQASSRAELWLERSLLLGAAAALAAPVAWKAAPIHTLILTGPVALAPFAAAVGALTLWRAARSLSGRERPAPRAPPRRATSARAAVLGLALGLGLGAAPTAFHGMFVQEYERLAAPQDHAVLVPGGVLDRAVLADLSANPVGRRVLDGLRDRSGAVRLPVFLVRREADAIASHVDLFDGVFIGENEIKDRGWTVVQFLADPAKQAEYVRENQAIFAHELTHAVQARRSPLEPGQYTRAMEYEYEAYVTEHLYVHEQLKADPRTPLVAGEIGGYELMLDDVDGFLRMKDQDPAYKDDVHIDSPRYRAWRARLERDWPAHQLQGYALLARRHANVPALVRGYRLKAAAVARAHGLPLPAELREPQVK